MSKKLTVPQVLRRFVFEEWGGTETVVWNTSKKLQQKGHNVEILATRALSDVVQETVEELPVKRFDYQYPYLNLSRHAAAVLDKKGGNPYTPALYRYLLRYPDVDMYHCHTMNRMANTVRRVALKRKVPYVISFHGGFFTVPQSEIDEMMKPLQGALNYGKFLDIAYQNHRYLQDASGIICVGYSEYEATREKYPDKIVTYLPNGVDIDRFELCGDNGFRQQYGIPEERTVLLCVSRIDYQKNQKRLIDLLPRLRARDVDAHVVLIGPVTSESYRHTIEAAIQQHDVASRVTIIPGLQPGDDTLIQAYHAADYFVLPSVHEPFGIVTLEAWASHLPVIVHHVGGLQKLVTDGETGLFFHNDDVDDLERAFFTYYDQPALQRNIIHKAYSEVCSTYSWSRITDTLVDFYNEVLEAYRR
jgi:glycosyltransferase involved in cell wall biosynthesis